MSLVKPGKALLHSPSAALVNDKNTCAVLSAGICCRLRQILQSHGVAALFERGNPCFTSGVAGDQRRLRAVRKPRGAANDQHRPTSDRYCRSRDAVCLRNTGSSIVAAVRGATIRRGETRVSGRFRKIGTAAGFSDFFDQLLLGVQSRPGRSYKPRHNPDAETQKGLPSPVDHRLFSSCRARRAVTLSGLRSSNCCITWRALSIFPRRV
jgi:hypothetical protein